MGNRMILLKRLDNNETAYPSIIVEMSADDVCSIHNGLCELAKNDKKYMENALAFTNLYEMLHHGHLTDFGIYKNAKYFHETDDFSNWEQEG